MGSLFEIAKSGIQAYRQALAVTGQNIANVNTDGYHKRDAGLEEIGGVQGGVTDVSDQTGLGVRVGEIRRSFNAYLSQKLRSSFSNYEQSDLFSKEISLLENGLLPESSDLGTFIGKFFSALQEVAASPADMAPRTVAIESGKDLANSFNDYAERLNQTQEGAYTQTKLSIEKINLLANQLANVNSKLKSSGATTSANDLLDTRDRLLLDLAKEVEFTTDYSERGDVTIRLGNSGRGPVLVSPIESYKLRAKLSSNKDFRWSFEQNVNNVNIFIVKGTKETSTNQVTGGRIAGLVNFYAYVQEVRSDIDGLADRITKDFNEAQNNGKNLEGDIGKSMFSIGLPSVELTKVDESDLKVSLEQVDSNIRFSKGITFEWNEDAKAWINDNNDKQSIINSSIGNKGPLISMEGFNVRISGTPKSGDFFTVQPRGSIFTQKRRRVSSGFN